MQLLARCMLYRDIALVVILKIGNSKAHLRAQIADVGVVAAAGYAEAQIGKLRQDCGSQFGVLRAITELECDQVGPPLGQRGQRQRHGFRVPRRQVRRGTQW